MARINWLNPDTELPALDEHVEQLEHFVACMADGVIETDERAAQEKNLIAAMRTAQDMLDDAQHAAVTRVLVELSAYNVMQLFHDLAAERARLVTEQAGT